MTRRTFGKRARLVAAGLLCGAAFPGWASAQGSRFSPEHRRPVEDTLRDLNRIAADSPYDRHQRERYEKAILHLQQFAQRLHGGGYFDKGKLDDALGDLQGILNHNRMSNRAHDVLMQDVAELRALRQHYVDRNRYH